MGRCNAETEAIPTDLEAASALAGSRHAGVPIPGTGETKSATRSVSSGCGAASRVLAFPNTKQSAVSWFHSHIAVVVCVVGISFLVIAIPAWYVISLAGDRENKQQEAALALQQAREAEERSIQERIERLNAERRELLETKRFIEQQSNTLNLELAQLAAESRRHQEVLQQRER